MEDLKVRIRRKTKNDNFDKQKLLDSNKRKKCTRCKKKKLLRDFQLKQEFGRWYPLYVCKLCQSKLKNEKRKHNIEYKKVSKVRDHRRHIMMKETLTDQYVAGTMHLNIPNSKVINKYPELIKAKRVILKIKKMVEKKNELQE